MNLFKFLSRFTLKKELWPPLSRHHNFRKSPGELRTCVAGRALDTNTDETTSFGSENVSQKKILKVAILGRPNAGKSTLINQMLKMNVCDVSCKHHTTRFPLRAAFNSGNTQIVFVDTPGLVTRKEFTRFKLNKTFIEWKEEVLQEVDIVGLIFEAPFVWQSLKIYSKIIDNLEVIRRSKPVFLILNKIDLVIQKKRLLKICDVLTQPNSSEKKLQWNFSKFFLVSALKSKGIQEVIDYLLLEAKPGQWLLESGKICDKPLHELVVSLLRASMLEVLPHNVPYECFYEVELLEENELGEIVCEALVTCKCISHHHLIVKKRKNDLKRLAQALESDLYRILGKVFRLRIVLVVNPKKLNNRAWFSSTDHAIPSFLL